jgi:hypothetical protein
MSKLDKSLPNYATDKVWWSSINNLCSKRRLNVLLFLILAAPNKGQSNSYEQTW